MYNNVDVKFNVAVNSIMVFHYLISRPFLIFRGQYTRVNKSVYV